MQNSLLEKLTLFEDKLRLNYQCVIRDSQEYYFLEYDPLCSGGSLQCFGGN